MGDWYTVGLVLGIGVACGMLAAGILPRIALAAIIGAALGSLAGFLVEDWNEELAGLVGGIAGALGATPVVQGALRRGGTRGGIAALVAGGALCVAALAFVPFVGYLLVVLVPLLGLRLRSREPERHAGLRTLARD
jgi:hypothetical protein